MRDIFKVMGLNGAALGVVTFTQLEAVLKIGLLVLTLAYTGFKFWCAVVDRMHKRNDKLD